MAVKFEVEGRYFPNSLQAFTFAQMQADKMDRPVDVHVYDKQWQIVREHFPNMGRTKSWHATAHPAGTRLKISSNGHRYNDHIKHQA